jgi:predicted O-methyltransferase YrrM
MRKLEYIYNKIKNIQNIEILELGVQNGLSTKMFLKVCNDNNGNLISVDINDCSNVSDDKKWKFIHSNDDNFNLINPHIKKSLDLIFIDSLHEPEHVQKVFYNYYEKLKKNGICIIDDISWLPYTKDSWRDNDFVERINRLTFEKILEISIVNKENFTLEFFFEDSGFAIITKNTNNTLNAARKIPNRLFSFKNLLKKIYSPKPKN